MSTQLNFDLLFLSIALKELLKEGHYLKAQKQDYDFHELSNIQIYSQFNYAIPSVFTSEAIYPNENLVLEDFPDDISIIDDENSIHELDDDDLNFDSSEYNPEEFTNSILDLSEINASLPGQTPNDNIAE